MNDLYEKQTGVYFLKLLAAQKQTYIEGKNTNTIILIVTLLCSIIFPVLVSYFPESKLWIGLSGGFLSLFVTIFLKDKPKRKAEIAARIQEEFDTALYNLEWNKSLAKEKIRKADIEAANEKLKDRNNIDAKEADPWYKNYHKLEHSQAILECQQENLWWDSQQRKKYSTFLTVIAIGLFVLGWIWGFVILELHHLHVLATVFFPISGFLVYQWKTIKNNNETALKQTLNGEKARGISEKYKASKQPIPTKELRNLQDSIFEMRKNSDLVPEWFYAFHKKYFEKILRLLAKDINQ